MTEDKRLALLRSTVKSVAKYGMQDVSTRSVSGDAGINDAYIYRLFKDKEDLLKQAYLLENEKYMRYTIKCMKKIYDQSDGITAQERFRLVFHAAWRYLLDTPDVCRFFVYYYHSPSFAKYAFQEYRQQLDLLAEMVLPLFNSQEDAKSCLYVLFILLNSFALQVLNEEIPDNDSTENQVCAMAYNAISAQMKKDIP